MGNFVAEGVAISSLKMEVAEIKTLSAQIVAHDKSKKLKLDKVYRYLADYNHKSMWEAQRLTTRHEQDGKVIRSKKDSYKEIVATWQVTVPLVVK